MIKAIPLFLTLIGSCANLEPIRADTHQLIETRFTSNDSTSYKVYKIDSINSWYLIYAKKKDSLFKIVSKKEPILSCERIKLESEYKFSLSSIWYRDVFIGNVNVSPGATPHVNCVGFDKSTVICLERDSINDLFYSANIKGLCFKDTP